MNIRNADTADRERMSAARAVESPAYQPFRWASVDFTIGLRPVRKSEWIQFSSRHADHMREKRSRLSAQRDRYYRTLPESLPAQRELRKLVVAHLATDHADRYALTGSTLTSRHESLTWHLDDRDVEPLRQLSDVIEEDFMLLQELDGVMRITASSNAYSSSGRLVSAIGQTVHWAHIPVPTLSDKLGARIDRVLSSVHEDTPCERFNWQVTPMATLFFPHDPHRANADAMHSVRDTLCREPGRAGELLFIRVERQTLSRLPASRAVAFSLHTYSDPLSVLGADPQAARSMLNLLEGYSESRWHYSEMDIVREPLLDYLRQVAAAA
jgi:Haem-dependent oxidative N-demethylase, alpha subunit-like